MKIREANENIDFKKIVKQLVDERDNFPTDVDFLIKAEDPAKELLKYCVYHRSANSYSDCIREIAHDMFAFEALLTYFSTIDNTMFMMIETDASDRYENPHEIVKVSLNPWLSNYIRINDLPASPILDIFLDLLKRCGWWTPDGQHYFERGTKKTLVSKIELD